MRAPKLSDPHIIGETSPSAPSSHLYSTTLSCFWFERNCAAATLIFRPLRFARHRRRSENDETQDDEFVLRNSFSLIFLVLDMRLSRTALSMDLMTTSCGLSSSVCCSCPPLLGLEVSIFPSLTGASVEEVTGSNGLANGRRVQFECLGAAGTAILCLLVGDVCCTFSASNTAST